MSNILEFVLQFKKVLGLAEATSTSLRGLNSVDKGIANTQKNFGAIGQAAQKMASAVKNAVDSIPETKTVNVKIKTVDVAPGEPLLQGLLNKNKKADYFAAGVASGDFLFKSSDFAKKTEAAIQRPIGKIELLQRALRRAEFRKTIAINDSDIRKASRTVDALQGRLDRLSGNRNTGSGFRLPGWLATGAVAAALTAGVVGVASAGMQGSARQVSFQTMAGRGPGTQLYNDLTGYAQKTIYGNEVYQNAQTLMAFGVQAKEIMPDLKMIGDIAMGNKEKMAALSLAFAQTTSAGKLMGQDLLQYVNAGFNPLQIIAEKTGKKLSDLRNMVSNGQISAQAVRQAFVSATSAGGRFYDMTNKIGQTAFGKWEAFRGQLQGIALQLGTRMLPSIAKLTDVLSKDADKLVPALTNLFDKVIVPGISHLADLAIWVGKNADWLKYLVGIVGGSILVFRTANGVMSAYKSIVAITTSKVWGMASAIRTAAFWQERLNKFTTSFNGNNLGGNSLFGKGLAAAINLYEMVKEPRRDVYAGFRDNLQRQGKPIPVWMYPENKVSDITKYLNGVQKQFGPDFLRGLLSKYNQVALSGDKMYNTHLFTDRFNSIANALGGVGLPNAGVVVKGKGSGLKFDGINGDGSADTADAITGGGRRPINININKSFVEHFEIHAQKVEEGYDKLKDRVGQIFLEILNSAAGAN